MYVPLISVCAVDYLVPENAFAHRRLRQLFAVNTLHLHCQVALHLALRPVPDAQVPLTVLEHVLDGLFAEALPAQIVD